MDKQKEAEGDVPPVVVQPGGYEQQQMMPLQQQTFNIPGIPPGLEYLASLNKVCIFQVLHLVEVLTGFERNNKYRICNESEQQFLTAQEDTDCLTRQCCGSARPFDMFINTTEGAPIMQLRRPLRCQGCCCPCCLQEMTIECPPGNVIGTIKEKWTCMIPRYEIFDASDQLQFTVEGDCCYCKCCADVVFRVCRANGEELGAITKHWAGCREILGGVNNFSVSFPPNEPPLNKAILLGSTFLVDFMYFEIKNNN